MNYPILFLLSALTLLSGCGATIHVDPITVNHKVDFSQIAEYCQNQCQHDSDPQSCVDACYTKLVNLVLAAGGSP